MESFSILGKALKLNNESDVTEYVNTLKSNMFESVVLSGNSIGVEASRLLFGALKDNVKIKNCNFSDIFTGRLLSEIPQILQFMNEALSDKQSLHELDLSDNAFGPNGARVLIHLLKDNKAIKVLKLNNTGLGPEGSTLIAEGLSNSNSEVPQVSQLEVFIAGRSRLENTGVTQLANAFASMKSIVELCIPQNGIYQEGFEKLFEALLENPNLRKLDVNDNNLKLVGAKALSNVLRRNTQIRHLDVGDCFLTKEGALEVINALKENEELEYLNMSYCDIDDEVAESLAECLKNKINLRKLDINGNKLREKGKELINDALLDLGKEDALGNMSENESGSDDGSGDDDNDDE